MNKRDTRTTKLAEQYRSIIFNDPNKFKPTKTIYIVKYKEVIHKPDSKITTNNTYNLFTFEDPNLANEYMDDAYRSIVTPHIIGENFKVILDIRDNILPNEKDNVLYKRTTKLIGNNDRHKSQTMFFTFTVETINFKQKS